MTHKTKALFILCLSLLVCMSLFVACDNANDSENTNATDAATETVAEITTKSENTTETEVTPKEESLSSIACKNELSAALEKAKSSKNFKYEENGCVYAYCIDEGDVYIYFTEEGMTNNYETWIGKVGNEYYVFQIESNDGTVISKICEPISKSDAETYVDDDFFYYMEHVIEKVENSTSFECLKTTGTATVYQIKAVESDTVWNITVTIADGYITEISYKDYVTATYDYDFKITMPDKADFVTE